MSTGICAEETNPCNLGTHYDFVCLSSKDNFHKITHDFKRMNQMIHSLRVMCDGNGGSLFPPFFSAWPNIILRFCFTTFPAFFNAPFFLFASIQHGVEHGVFQCSFQKMTNHRKVTKGLGEIIGEMTASDQVSSNLTQD